MSKFSHLHCHTQFSLLDGAASISGLYKKAKADGMPAIAITDHGNMFGVFNFVAEAAKHDNAVKPIVGCEFYLVDDRFQKTFSKEKKDRRYHQLFLAKNEEGYKNITKLCSLGFIDGYYSKYPRIDKQLVLENHKGLIATTCCLGARVPQLILTKGEDEARKEFEWWLDIFGEDYYIELQRHHLKEQEIVNQVLMKFAKEYNVKMIASNDSHYVDKEDANAHDILLCVNTGEKQATPKLDDYTDEDALKRNMRFAFPNDEFYFKSTAEMSELFHDVPQAIDNTNEIVDKVQTLKLKKDILLPHFQVPKEFGTDQDAYLTHLTYEGAKERYKDLTPEIEERLKFELFTIRTMGFAGYFLIVADFIKAGRDLGVFVGPGRGCLTGDTPVVLADGTSKNLDEIKIGDKIWTNDGSLKSVLNTFEYDVSEELIKIQSYYGDEKGVVLTKDHKVLAEKQLRPKNYDKWADSTKKSRKMPDPIGDLKWMKAEELEVGDWVFIPKLKCENKVKQVFKIDFSKYSNGLDLRHDSDYVYHDVLNPMAKKVQRTKVVARWLELDEDWFEIFGLFAGDGWIRKQYRPEVSFVFNIKETDKIEWFKNKIVNTGFEISEQYQRKIVQIHIRNKHLYLFFKEIFNRYESTSNSKHIPEIVMNGSENQKLAFLRGYNFADGHESKHKIKFTTTSKVLANQVRLLCWSVSIPAGLQTDKRKSDTREEFKNRSTAYMISIPKDNRIGENSALKQYIYRKVEGGIICKIRSVEHINNVKKVYDIEVEDNHNYLTSSFLVHNSAAGSAVAYCIGITNIDPIKYNLLFERFLNPDRKSMPDIDTDFDDEGRQKVIDYVVQKYGRNQVAHIVTYGTMAAKTSIKDVARVMDLPLDRSNALAKLVSDKPGISLNRTLFAPISGEGSLDEKEGLNAEDIENAKKLRFIMDDPTQEESKILKEAIKLEGSVRGTGIHAAGIIIAPQDLYDILPVCTAKDVELLVTQFEGSIIEDAGVIKMDFLGLRNLTIIRDALKLIKENHNIDIDIDSIPLDDSQTYELFQRGDTNAIFQFESDGMKKYLRELKPDRFDDLIAMNALYRPGPLEYIPNFINRKHGKEEVTYDLPDMEEYLKDTFGICLAGDALVYNPTTGERIRIDELKDKVGTYFVQGVGDDLKTQIAPITNWVCNGTKKVYEVKLKNGYSIKMTSNHKVLTEQGWQEIGSLNVGDYIATPNEFLKNIENIEEKNSELTSSKNIHIRWEEIVNIEFVGEELVYDITVDKIHNFIANNIIVHNCVYQEQIMLLSQKLAGFSKGDADVLRKAMGKKQKAVLDKMKSQFIAGATERGHEEKKLDKIWTDWEAFASYAFNKSHSTCYAFVAYQTAYLKSHYAAEYMAAVLTNNQLNIEKITFFMEECIRLGIKVLGPDINESNVYFSVNKKGEIRYALSAIKGVGEAAVEALIQERKKNGQFQTFFDFIKRMNLRVINKKVMESLAMAGAFDCFENLHRAQYFAPSDKYETFIEHALRFGNAYQENIESAQQSLFGDLVQEVSIPEPTIPQARPFSLIEKLTKEREMIGIFMSGHPLDDYRVEIKSFINATLGQITQKRNQRLRLAAFVISVEHRISKKGTGWGKMIVQDYKDTFEIALFSEDYLKYRHLMEEGSVLYIQGSYVPVRWKNDQLEFEVQDMKLMTEVAQAFTKSILCRIPIEVIDTKLIDALEDALKIKKGDLPISFEIVDTDSQTLISLKSKQYKVKYDDELSNNFKKLPIDFKLIG